MHIRTLLTFSACLLSWVSTFAQRVGLPGGEIGAAASGYIDVDIQRNFGGGLQPLSIEVASGGIPMARTLSSPIGSTAIGPLRAGHYTVIVSGPGISSAVEEVDLNDMVSRRRVVVTVDRDPNQVVKGGTGTVDAAELNAPSDAKKHFGKGLKLAKDRHWEKAIAEFEKAAEIFPNYGSAYAGIGIAYHETNQPAKAEESFKQAVQVNPSDGMALRWLGKLSIEGRNFVEAQKYLESANRYDPGNDDVLVMLAWARLENGNTQASIETALRVSEKSNQAVTAHYIAGRGYEVANQREAALAQYRMCTRENTQSPNAQLAQRRIAALAGK